ncbi:alpha/beta hydrolase [Nocardioides sp. CCNWLW239]|uniref:alpha/beta hydrolase n=1 Tax=Nocardioides sp. CCNWLW239 TaxID=3128902 RepID=UPI0030167A7E
MDPTGEEEALAPTVTSAELRAVEAANRSGRPVVVLVHGMFLHASSWREWQTLFEGAGYATVAPGWPGEADSVAATRAAGGSTRRQDLRAVLAHHRDLIGRLDRPPALVGHCAGGWVVQRLASEGLASVTVAMEPTPFRGVLPISMSTVRSALPVVARPRHYRRPTSLTFEQFRYSWGNSVDVDEARDLYDRHHVPAPGAPLFQAAVANLSPWSTTRIDTRAADRGPLLFIAGAEDRQATWPMTHAAYRRHRRNPHPTEIVEMPHRGHTMPVDHGWSEAALLALSFIERHIPSPPVPAARPENS